MQSVPLFLSGFLIGGLVVRWLIMGADRRHRYLSGLYEPALRATLRYLQSHGTINVAQLERLLSVSGVTAMHYLDRMEREGVLKLHGHRGVAGFYTRA
jgi:hypothetical protein